MIFNYQDMLDVINEVAYDDNADSTIAERLQEFLNQFFSDYNPIDVETAIFGNQADLFQDYPEDYKKHLKAFKKLKPEFIYEVTSQFCFMFGLAWAEAERLRFK